MFSIGTQSANPIEDDLTMATPGLRPSPRTAGLHTVNAASFLLVVTGDKCAGHGVVIVYFCR